MEEYERPTKQRKLNSYERTIDHEGESEQLETSRDLAQSNPDLGQSTENADSGNNDTNSSDENGEDQNDASPPIMSKNQLKKLRRQEKWAAGKEFRKAKRKQKAAEKRIRQREAREKGTREANGAETSLPLDAPARKTRFSLVPVTFIIDCGFDDLMNDRERISLASQLTRVYSDNHRASLQGHLAISSFNLKLKERFETVLRNHHHNWKNVMFSEIDFSEASKQSMESMKEKSKDYALDGAFTSKDTTPAEELHAQGEVIYLSSESPNTLQELQPFSTYIIGGLVDKNRHKGICYKVACDKGIKTAKLPISEFMEMQSRNVLATNHVVEIMLKWLECGDWGQAFLNVIPKRKGGSLKAIVGSALEDSPQEDTSL